MSHQTKITHVELTKIVQKLRQDYEPYGKTKRWNRKDPTWDCSCECIFFIGLSGRLELDWGVCCNPKSHRCGLLTFEHQGCLEFVGA